MIAPLLDVRAVSKRYRAGNVDLDALADVTISIAQRESVAIMGPSGSGKSTLMHLFGCLDLPTSGACFFDGQDVGKLSRRKLAILRRRYIGFIFQNFSLLPRVTALENVELPLVYAGVRRRERTRRARDMLDAVGLADRAHHLSSQLSGGQQQRVAVARALVAGPKLVLADEPTGSLDTRSSEAIMSLLADINAGGITVVLITHDPSLAATMRRVITLLDGRVISDRASFPAPGARIAVA